MSKSLFMLGSALSIATPAMAQESAATTPDDASTITVLATGTALQLDRTGQPISVVTAEEIDSIQGPDLTRVLERLPGVTLTRNGGFGGFTGLRVRGANAEQVLVLVDGIRVADVAAPGGGYDFGNLTSGGIGRIELLRGSNSVVWGSEAIGGVVAITSRGVNGVEASAEYGARDSFDGQVSAGLQRDRYGIDLNGGYTRTDGFSQAAVGTERDGFRQWRANGRGRFEITPGLTASLVGRYTDGKLDIDGYPAPTYTFADTPEYQKSREWGGRAGLAYVGAGFSLDGGYQISDTRRRYYDPTFSADPNYETRGRTERAEVKGVWSVADALRLDFGGDHEWSRIDVSFEDRRTARLASGHALLGWYGDVLTVTGGVRYDDHSRFGDQWTFGGNGSLAFAEGWRARASYGEGFKVPTLYQLFSNYGNEALRPERSRSYDAGIERGDRNGAGFFGALTLFRRDSRNLIDFVPCAGATCATRPFGFYENVGRARAQGIELELGARVSANFRAQAAYTYLEAKNRTAGSANRGNDLARRPRHAITVSADWITPLAGLTLGGDIRMVSDSYDDMGNFTRIDGRATGTVRASVPVGERLELFGRIENVTDANYEETAGYGTAGRSAFVGVRARM